MPFRAFLVTIIIYTILSIISPLSALPAATWVPDGDSLNISRSTETSLAATPHALFPSITFKGGTPYISWPEINNKGVSIVYVKHKEGKEWVPDGGPLNISLIMPAASPAIAAAQNNIYVAWSEPDSKNIARVYVKRWDGGEWGQTGGVLNVNTANHASNPVLSGGYSSLYVAWSELDSAGISLIYVKEWDGSSWRLLGGEMNKSSNRHAMTPSVVADKDGLYLAWAEYDNHSISQIYVGQWNGKTWEDLGGVININTERHALSPSISLGDSTPYIAWMEYDAGGASQIYVKRWNGKEWIQMGGSLNIDATRQATVPSLAMKGNIPYVAWAEIDESGISYVYVKHWKGSSWVQDGAYLNITADRVGTAPSIAIKGEEIYVAFSEADANRIYQLYVKRLEGKGDAIIAPPSTKEIEGAARRKGSSTPTFFKSIPKDPAAEVLPPPLAYKYLPKDHMGEVDWMTGIREGLLKPFDSTDPEARPSLPLYMDMPMPIKKGFGIPDVLFPHSSHTMWLDCRNCHPTIFQPRRGGNPVTMHRIIEGEYCGRCHGVVAFRLYDCFRCHSGQP